MYGRAVADRRQNSRPARSIACGKRFMPGIVPEDFYNLLSILPGVCGTKIPP
jgi:hypothetical protein